MSLMDLVGAALQNPDQQADRGELSGIVGVLAQLGSQHGRDPEAMQGVLSTVGNYVRSALQKRRAREDEQGVHELVNRYAGTRENPQAVQTLFSQQEQEQVAQAASQRTGLPTSAIMAMLPSLVPLVLKLLQSGSYTQGQAQGANPVLATFLNAEKDHEADVGNALNLVTTFFGNR